MKVYYTLFYLTSLLIAQSHAGFADVLWANKVLSFSSEYLDSKRTPQYRAIQVLGKPNKLPAFGSSPVAWSPSQPNFANGEWIHVAFERSMAIQQIAIAESFNPGAVKEVYVYDVAGNEYLVYSETEKQPIFEKSRILNIFIEPTSYQVISLKVVMDTRRIEGWNHLDAIAISDEKNPIQAGINLAKSTDGNIIESLGPSINSAFDEVFPVIVPDGKTLYFDRKNHPKNTNPQSPNDDIWYVTKKAATPETWGEAKRMDKPLNNKHPNYVCSVTPDGNTLLLGNVYHKNGTASGGISISNRIASGWSFPKPLVIKEFHNLSDHSEYCLSPNRKTLILAIETEESLGDRDLYASFQDTDGTWSKPMHMGNQINSAGTELTPFLASDGYTLYFSSAGFSGYGLTDIFMTRRLDDTWTNWSAPLNIGPVFNSADWDASCAIDATGEYAYFVSYQNRTKSADIYKAKLPFDARPYTVSLVTGLVFNSKTKEPITAEIIYETLPAGEEAGTALSTPKDGRYTIALPNGQQYGFWAKAKGYIPIHENLNLADKDKYQETERNLYLTPLEVGQSILLNNVNFVLGKSTLLKESYAELNNIVGIMLANPEMKILLEGHTDYVGNPIDNMKLSRERVIAVKKYLLDRGVNNEKIEVDAFGGSKPLVRSESQDDRLANRRVELKIIAL